MEFTQYLEKAVCERDMGPEANRHTHTRAHTDFCEKHDSSIICSLAPVYLPPVRRNSHFTATEARSVFATVLCGALFNLLWLFWMCVVFVRASVTAGHVWISLNELV